MRLQPLGHLSGLDWEALSADGSAIQSDWLFRLYGEGGRVATVASAGSAEKRGSCGVGSPAHLTCFLAAYGKSHQDFGAPGNALDFGHGLAHSEATVSRRFWEAQRFGAKIHNLQDRLSRQGKVG